MKKSLFVLLFLLVMSNIVYARPAIFNLDDLTLEFQCLRVVNCGNIISEDDCYSLVLQYVDPDFTIQHLSLKGNFPKEDDDQIFNCQNFELTLPYVSVGQDAYSVKLELNAENNHMTIKEIGGVDDGGSNNHGEDNRELVGNCFFDTAGLTKQNFCITYFGENHRTDARNACQNLGGTWTPDHRCSGGDLGSCTSVTDNGVLQDIDYYDAGIVSLANLAGRDVSFIKGGLMEDCDRQGGVWFDN